MNWVLGNSEKFGADNLKFKIPEVEERNSLQAGTFVRLAFLTKEHNAEKVNEEQMWVMITENIGDHYIGILDNYPNYIHSLKRGDQIAFRPENILDILPEDD